MSKFVDITKVIDNRRYDPSGGTRSALGMRLVSTRRTVEVYETSYYRDCVSLRGIPLIPVMSRYGCGGAAADGADGARQRDV